MQAHLNSIRFNQLSDILSGQCLQQPAQDAIIGHLLTDSRKLLFATNGLFIAHHTERNNGHKYLKDAYLQGVRMFLVQTNAYDKNIISQLPEAGLIEVANTLEALQKLASLHRQQFHYPLLAITGSNGKTIVKEWLCFLLKNKQHLVRNPKSYNSQLGVPLSVWQMDAEHTFAIFEAGISQPKEMEKLAQILTPTHGILTLIGDAHNEGFTDKAHKLSEKLKLFTHCPQVLYGMDQELVHEQVQSLKQGKKYVSWSKENPAADYYISVQTETQKTTLRYLDKEASIPFTDEAAIWNACTAMAFLAMTQQLDQDTLQRFSELPPLDMRLQLKQAQQNCLLINDAYSADLGSLLIALDFQEQHAQGKTKTLFLSDFLESGLNQTALYERIAAHLHTYKIDKLIGIGPEISLHQEAFKLPQKHFFSDVKDFLQSAHLLDFSHEIILLKGARKFEFEKLGKWFEKQVHQTVFEINLNALLHNFNAYKKLLKPQVKVMAMVKAFSYGAGSYEIARVLSYHQADYLTVAYADEGVTLRAAGITTPIMVMNPEPASFDAILKYNLEPEVYHFNMLEALIAAADGEEIGIHIELDTGMKRLGFDAAELPLLLQTLQLAKNIKVNSVFTHLAASEDPQHDAFTLAQIERFKQLSQQICEAFPYPILRHCLNSGGIARFKEAQFDMVRLGIGLYGIDPAHQHGLNLEPIGTLKTIISQIRTIDKTESIGYGRKGKLTHSGNIAIVAIGYADGLDRKLSNGNGYMLVNGQKAPIVGNICMDMTMLDVSDIACKEGDEVIVFGQEPSLLKLSEQIGTIPYEILTGVSQRVKRVYFYE
jgi:Alr-MurF fusion protein